MGQLANAIRGLSLPQQKHTQLLRLDVHYEEVESQLDSFQEQNSVLQEKNNALQAQNKAIRKENDKMKDEYNLLKKELKRLKKEVVSQQEPKKKATKKNETKHVVVTHNLAPQTEQVLFALTSGGDVRLLAHKFHLSKDQVEREIMDLMGCGYIHIAHVNSEMEPVYYVTSSGGRYISSKPKAA